MCTIGRTSLGTTGKAYHQPDEAKCTAWREQGREDYDAVGCRNSFLTMPLIPLSPQSLTVDSYDGHKCETVNVITQENYEFLRDSYIRYAELLQKEAKHAPGHSIGEGIAKLYDEMKKLIGDDLNVNIEHDNGRLYFNLWKCHQWGHLTLYYFPVKFVETLNPTLRRISITFIHTLMKANGISIILDEDDTDYVFMWLKEADSQEEAEETEKRLKLIRSYEKGRIGRLLKQVESKSYYKNLPKVLERYIPQNDFERTIIELMKKGLSFLTPEQGIMQYGYDAYYEEEPGLLPMYLQQQIRVVYDCEDMVSEFLVDYYNSSSRETYDIIPVTTCALTPDTGSLFSMDDYPERFFKWADEFINAVY